MHRPSKSFAAPSTSGAGSSRESRRRQVKAYTRHLVLRPPAARTPRTNVVARRRVFHMSVVACWTAAGNASSGPDTPPGGRGRCRVAYRGRDDGMCSSFGGLLRFSVSPLWCPSSPPTSRTRLCRRTLAPATWSTSSVAASVATAVRSSRQRSGREDERPRWLLNASAHRSAASTGRSRVATTAAYADALRSQFRRSSSRISHR
jgi:hypothetical protein